MAPATSTKLTYEDYCLLPDDGRRHEILDGEHYVNPAPNIPHQRISRKLVLAIAPHVEKHHLGEVFYAPCDVVLSEYDIVEPDIVFVSTARRHIIKNANIQGAPDLVVEILSPSNRKFDEHFKLKLYDAAGVAEYWIVDPEAETIVMHRRSGRNFVRVTFNEYLTTPLLPGFSMPVAAIFDPGE